MTKSKRNSLCKCGSGKKYKHCCGASYEQRGARRNARSQNTKDLGKPLERMESFLGHLWDKKLWTLTWGGFLYCLYFVVSFYLSFPIELAKVEMYEERARFYQSDLERAKAIIENTEQSLASFGETTKLSLLALFSADSDKNTLNLNQNALQSISKLRRDISYSLGAIRSGAFQSTYFVDFFKGYEEDLANLDRYLVYFQEVLTTTTIRNKVGARLDRINNSAKFVESHHSLSQRTAGSLKRLEAIVSQARVERDEQHRKSTLLRLKLTFVFLGLAYIGLFLLLAVMRWHKFNRTRKSKLANTIEGVLESTERFADYANNRKLWGLGSFLFGICFWFVVSTINAAPVEIATIERFKARIKLTNEDSIQIGLFWIDFDRLYERQDELSGRMSETLKHFENDPRTVVQERFEGDIAFFVSLRGEISKQLGTSKGLTFQSSDYANYFAHVDENLRRYDEVVASLEKIHHGVLEHTLTAKEVSEVLSNPKLDVVLPALRESVRTAQEKLVSDLKVLDIEEKEYEAHKKTLIMRVIAIIPSTFYILGFSFVAIRSWIKFRRRTF